MGKKAGLRLKLPKLGQVLSDRYRIEDKIAGGTYGIVYLATHLETNDSVAVKCLLPSAATSKAVVQRFEREVLVIRELQHPNFISILDQGFDPSGVLFYVMERLEGEDLGARLRRGVLPPKGAALVATQVLLALEEAHQHQFVHRDLKPENVFLQVAADGRVRVRVLDFGIVKLVGERAQDVERLTLTNEACGTPNYMAPEQITGGTIGPWTDLYALGLILYEMVTGKMAVQGDTFIETLRLQTTTKPDIGPDLEGTPMGRVLNKVLEKRPEDRYRSAGEMRLALQPVFE